MTACTLLSERMPAVARGVARWSAAEAAHLETCADCAGEWKLVRAVASLPSGLAATFDAPRVAERVVAALRVPAARPSPLRHVRWALPLALAASLLLVFRPAGPPAGNDPLGGSLLPEAEQLTDGELEMVLRLLPTAVPADFQGADDLNEDEITEMLKDLEG